jgi:phage major head subunit gpT-like protein
MRAIDWEPYEISVVPMPADAGAQIRQGEETELFPLTVVTERTESSMADKKNKDVPQSTPPPPAPEQTDRAETTPSLTASNPPAQPPQLDARAITTAAKKEENTRVQDIWQACRTAKLPEDFAWKMINDNVSIDKARAQIIDKWAEEGEAMPDQRNNVSVQVTQDHTVTRRSAISNAILHRTNMEKYELDEAGAQYRGLSLLELSRRILDFNGINHGGLSRSEIATRALSTSDFPEILANVINKTLRDAYMETPQTFEKFVRVVDAPDFKEMSRTQLGEAPKFRKVLEDGEIVYGEVTEGAEKYSIATYARGIVITRKAIINDDLNAFSRFGVSMGQQARNLESDLVWGIITGNPVMSDAKTLFHADHNNLAGAGATISDTTLTNAVTAMMTQKGLDGESHIVVTPVDLYVPVALRTLARKYIATSIRPGKASDVNPFAGEFGVVAEPRLDVNSAISWYLFSSVAFFGDMVELAVLDGRRGPQIETYQGQGVDGVRVEGVYDLGTKAIDWRGFYKNPGA